MTHSEFQVLFNKVYNSLCNYANAIVSDYDQSEDLVQDVLYNFWNSRNSVEVSADKYENYLIRAVKYKCIDVHRQKAVKRKYESETLRIQSEPAEMESNDAPDYRAILLEAMAQLPEKTRQVFTMSKIDGLKYQEIADALEVSIKTVENQMGRAFKHLRVIIKDKNLFEYILFFMVLQ